MRSRGSGPGSTRRFDAGQRHQRQDDNGGDDRRAILAAGPPSGPQPGRLEHGLGRRHRAARAARQRGAVRGRRGLAADGQRRSCGRALLVLANLFRDQLDRYGELERLADEWAEVVAALEHAGAGARAQRRRPAGRRPRPRRRAAAPGRRHLLRHRGPNARRCPSCSTPTTPSTAAAVAHPTGTSAPSSATSATTTARTAAPAARPPTSPPDRSSCSACAGSRFDVTTPEGRARCRAAPPRPLQRLQRARRDRRRAAPRASASSAIAGALWPESRPSSAGSRRSRSAAMPLSILLIKNPVGANEVLRTLRQEAGPATGRSTSGSRSTTGSPTAATSPGSGTPTSSCSRRAYRKGHLRRHRAPTSWRCG